MESFGDELLAASSKVEKRQPIGSIGCPTQPSTDTPIRLAYPQALSVTQMRSILAYYQQTSVLPILKQNGGHRQKTIIH